MIAHWYLDYGTCLYMMVKVARLKYPPTFVILVDLVKGLSIIDVSFHTGATSTWNRHNMKDIETLFEFANGYLAYDAPLLVYLREAKIVRNDVRTLYVMVLQWQRVDGP